MDTRGRVLGLVSCMGSSVCSVARQCTGSLSQMQSVAWRGLMLKSMVGSFRWLRA